MADLEEELKAEDEEQTAETEQTAAESEAQPEQNEEAGDVGRAEEAEQSEEAEETAEEEETKKGKSHRKREKKSKQEEQIEELNDRLIRQIAEFDNYRKRTEKEKSRMFDMGASTIVEKILPVLDSFERGLAAVSKEEKDNSFVQGMDKVYRQMTTALTEAGVTPIEAAGAEFDPELHNAVMHVEDESLGENVVVEELQKGYRYKDTVVRHSMVKVAN